MNDNAIMNELYEQAEIIESHGIQVSSDTTTVVNPDCPSVQMIATNPGWPKTATTREEANPGLIAGLRLAYAKSLREERRHD